VRQHVAPAPALRLPDRHEFAPALYGARPIYNGAFLPYAGRLIQTVRIGPPNNTETWLGTLGQDLRPEAPFRCVSTPSSSKEDMRLFTYRGDLWASFADLDKEGDRVLRVHTDLCRIEPDLTLGARYAPKAPDQTAWEKNWLFFEHDDYLYFVYSVDPHRVCRLEPGRAPELVGVTPTRHAWGETLRGGAPPVRVGDRYVALFHAGNPSRRFGWYEFEARPPFRVTRVGATPILEGPRERWCVYYPISLARVDGRFYISYGQDDCRLHLMRWEGPR